MKPLNLVSGKPVAGHRWLRPGVCVVSVSGRAYIVRNTARPRPLAFPRNTRNTADDRAASRRRDRLPPPGRLHLGDRRPAPWRLQAGRLWEGHPPDDGAPPPRLRPRAHQGSSPRPRLRARRRVPRGAGPDAEADRRAGVLQRLEVRFQEAARRPRPDRIQPRQLYPGLLAAGPRDHRALRLPGPDREAREKQPPLPHRPDRKSTRLNSSHVAISYA